MRPIIGLLLWLVTVSSAYAEPTIHFVALAGVKAGKEAQYDAFIKAVTPIWKRHGMTVVARARPVAPFRKHKGVVDLAVLRVESRSGFYAYSKDLDYRALQPKRAEAVDFLAVFDGTVSTSGEPGLRDSSMLRAWFVARPGADWAKILAVDLSKPSTASLKIDLGIVGQVKGELATTLAATRTIHVEAIDERGADQPPYLDGLYVVSGPRLR